jgi:glycosyltransferase involved in cell wall biosynthesis
MEPLVSVVVPTYQHAAFIRQCLDSILMQKTNFNFEIILGEDESIDGTRDICIEYSNKYPDKIRLFLRSRKDVIFINGRATGRYNFINCLKEANGKYIALCEGDDYWTDPLKLQKQVDFLEANEDFSICFHNANIVDNNNQFIKLFHQNPVKEITDFMDLISENWYIPTASMVFKRSSIDKLPHWFTEVFNGDYALQLILTSEGQKIGYLADIMGAYRIHGGGISNSLKTPVDRNNFLIAIFKNIRLYANHKYQKNVNDRISSLYLLKIYNSKKYSLSFFKAFYYYIKFKKTFTCSEVSNIFRNIVLPAKLCEKLFVKKDN